MSSDEAEKTTLEEFVKVLKEVKTRLISASMLRGAMIYIMWSTVVSGYLILESFIRGAYGASGVPIHVYIGYWVCAIAIMYGFLIKYVDPSIFGLEQRLRRNMSEVKRVYKRATILITVGWIASFLIFMTLIPMALVYMRPYIAGDMLWAQGLLLALGFGNLFTFLTLAVYLGHDDYFILAGSVILISAGLIEPILKSMYWDFAAAIIILSYNFIGVMYIMLSFRTLTKSE